MAPSTASTTGYLRYPDLHGDLLTFCAGDDVWLAPVEGGRAWRLSSDGAPVAQPRFSPDGSQVAWVSRVTGAPEVMVADVETASARRLTHLGAATTWVLGWHGDRVLVATTSGETERSHWVVKAVGPDGRVERLRYGPASGLALHPDGPAVVSTQFSRPPAWWKRYRGGTAQRLWLARGGVDHGEGAADPGWERLLPDEEASLDSPGWVGDQLVFTSDLAATFPDRADAQADLYALDVLGSGDLRRITHHTADQGYVRDPRTDGRRVVYHAHGALYRLDDLDAEPEPVPVVLGGALAGRRPRPLDPTRGIDEVRPDQGADGSLVGWRGKVFWLAHRDGPARALAASDDVRRRLPRWLGRTGRAIWAAQSGGEDRLETTTVTGAGTESVDGPVDGPTVVVEDGLGRVLHLTVDTAGSTAAVITHDGRVVVVDVATGTTRELHRSVEGEAIDPTFSPDGRYLVWSEPVDSDQRHRLTVADLRDPGAVAVPLTSGRFDDVSPAFTLDGRYLAFLSRRTFDPRYDDHGFDLSFASSTRPYLVPLDPADPAPFGPSAEGWRISADPGTPSSGTPAPQGDASDTADAAPADGPTLAVEGFEDRLIAFPVVSSDYRGLRAVADGVAWIHESADRGAIGSARDGVDAEPHDTLEVWSFTRRTVEVLVDRVDRVEVSGDGRRAVVVSGSDVTVVPTDKKVEDDSPDRVAVKTDRLHHELDPVVEWRQMFDENAAIMAQHYWREDMNGVDWAAVTARYRPLVDRLGSHDDLVDVLWETVAELNSSHAYVRAPDRPDAPPAQGLLGADLSPADGGWRIDRILPGESSDPKARSPLRAAGVGAEVGDLVVAVAGRPVDPAAGPAAGLHGAAGKPTELTLQRPDGARRRVVVVPIDDELTLRYQDWVRGRSAYVDEHGAGRLGYVHIPDMMGLGWAQLHRDLHTATQREGLVVDVRYNGGGHTSQLVIERLARRVIGWDLSRHHAGATPYPAQAPRGPVIFVTNQQAGSDGDIVNAAAQALGIGPVVGMRTWGGVIGIDGRFDLVDGTGITQPRYSFWFRHLGWGVENHGVDPDIVVEHTPADFFADRDPQLDRAISEALDRLGREPAATPPPLPEPRVRG